VSEELSFDAHGFERSRRWCDADGKPILTEEGLAERVLDRDRVGNVVAMHALGIDGKPVTTNVLSWRGATTITNQLDGSGDVVSGRYLDAAGKPFVTENGSTGWSCVFDDRGNRLRCSDVDRTGEPWPIDGVARTERTYDARNLEVTVAFLGSDGKPIIGREEFASKRSERDAKGHLVEERFFGVDGKLRRNDSGAAIVRYEYDARDRPTRWRYFDANDKPTAIKDGFASEAVTYDERNNPIETDYFDETGAPIGEGAPARLVQTFDDMGNAATLTFSNAHGEPVDHSDKDPYARSSLTFDDNGRPVEGAYFAAAAGDHPTLRERTTYDAYGQVVAVDSNGPDGKPSMPIARKVEKRDARGLLLEVDVLDGSGAPTSADEHPPTLKWTYDQRGNRINERRLDGAGKPFASDGIAGVDWKYDVFGRRIEETWLGPTLQPAVIAAGFATKKSSYDAAGRLSEEAYFDEAGKPGSAHLGYAIARLGYDDVGNRVLFSVFDGDGWPTRSKLGGFHTSRSVFNDRHGELRAEYLDEKGNAPPGSLAAVMTYDDRGFLVRADLVTPDGQPGKTVDGKAATAFKNDIRGRLTEEEYLDDRGRPVADKTGVAVHRHAYGAQLTRESYFGVDGQPVDNQDGWSTKETTTGVTPETVYRNAKGAIVKPGAPAKAPEAKHAKPSRN